MIPALVAVAVLAGSGGAAGLSRGAGVLPSLPAPAMSLCRAQGTVPSGDCILGTTTTAPSGYTYTGDFFASQAPGLNTWTGTASMPAVRDFAAGAEVNNDVYMIGGTVKGQPPALATNFVYKSASNTWSTAAAMPTARWGASASVASGKIYVIGGSTTGGFGPQVWTPVGNNEMFDPVAGTWTPMAAMPTPAVMFASASLGTTIYTFGGATPSYTGTTTTQAFNTSTNTWTTLAPMPTAAFGCSAVALGGLIYVTGSTGGALSSPELEIYNPTSNTWTQKAGVTNGCAFSALTVLGGSIYSLGGMTISGSSITPSTVMTVYNPATGGVTQPGQGNATWAAITATIGSKIFVAGGAYIGSIDLSTGTVTLTSSSFSDTYQAAHIYYIYKKN